MLINNTAGPPQLAELVTHNKNQNRLSLLVQIYNKYLLTEDGQTNLKSYLEGLFVGTRLQNFIRITT